jgi:hypothetical protein
LREIPLYSGCFSVLVGGVDIVVDTVMVFEKGNEKVHLSARNIRVQPISKMVLRGRNLQMSGCQSSKIAAQCGGEVYGFRCHSRVCFTWYALVEMAW